MPEPASPSPPGPIQSGELIHLEYELWAEGGGRSDLIDTTREELAQKELGKLPAGKAFGARPHLVGGEFFPSAVAQSIVGANIGTEFEKEFPPAEGFGERDPKLIELFSVREIERLPEMRRDDARLDVGTVLTIRGRRGRVVSLTAARVRIDFNPPFSGRKLRGKFKVIDRIVEPADQVHALLELEYGHAKEFHVEFHNHAITIRIPDRAKFDAAWFGAKPRVVDRLRTQLHPPSVKFVEEYVTPVPAKTGPPPIEPASGTPPTPPTPPSG